MPNRPVLVEDMYQADWLRVGPRAVLELFISLKTSDPCAIARQMRDDGQMKAPIFESVIDACRAKKEGHLKEYLRGAS